MIGVAWYSFRAVLCGVSHTLTGIMVAVAAVLSMKIDAINLWYVA